MEFPATLSVLFVLVTQTYCSPIASDGSTHTTANILEFYPDSKGDGLNIIWAHAANSQVKVNSALADDTMMIEADVSPEANTGIPIMAHPPHNTSDITLAEWIQQITTTKKGMKVDFKYIDVVPASLQIIKQLADKIHQPMWYNADIVHGPNSPKQPVDPDAFISYINEGFPNAVLSLGWTTAWSSDAEIQLYTWTMIFDMLNYTFPCSQPVTYPVRAVWASTSWDKWVWMLGLRDDFSISVWSSSNDDVDIEGLVTFRQYGDTARIYYDLPDSQINDFKDALQNAPDVIIEPDTPRWDKALWESTDSVENGDYVFLSTKGVGIFGGHRRASIRSKQQYKPMPDEAISISGRVQFVFRAGQSTYEVNDGVEIYIRSSDIIDGVRIYIGSNGDIRLESAVSETESATGQLGPSDCYSFEVSDSGDDTAIVVNVTPVKCSDGTGVLPVNTDPVVLSLQLPYANDAFYISITKSGDNIDVLLEDVILPSSSCLSSINTMTIIVMCLFAMGQGSIV